MCHHQMLLGRGLSLKMVMATQDDTGMICIDYAQLASDNPLWARRYRGDSGSEVSTPRPWRQIRFIGLSWPGKEDRIGNSQMAVLRTLKAQVQIRPRIHYLRTESGLDLHRCATRTEVLAKLLILEYLQTIPLRIEKGNLEPLACIISIWQE